MARAAVILFALLSGGALADGQKALTLPGGWTEVGFGPTEYFGEIVLLEMRNGSPLYNGHRVTEEQVVGFARIEAKKDPVPAFYIRVSRENVNSFYPLAEKLSESGICKRVHCLYTVAGRKYAKSNAHVVP